MESKKTPEEFMDDYRKELNSFVAQFAAAFDKHILSLSSGGLGLSITFLSNQKYFLGCHILLYASWFLFILAIAMTVFSFFVLTQASDWHFRKTEGHYLRNEPYPERYDNPYNICLIVMNWTAAISFTLALVVTAIYMGGAINGREESKKDTQVEEEKGGETKTKKGEEASPPHPETTQKVESK